MDAIRRAGFLNIVAKTAVTPLTNGRPVGQYIQRIHELRGDRFFAAVTRELREETKNSARAGLFEPALDVLHHPPAGTIRSISEVRQAT